MKGRVEKFRSIEEMNRGEAASHEEDGFERFARQCARYWDLAPRVYPRGVFKFRSLEEARAAREQMLVQTP
jgi:hypothetical protein